MFYLEHVKNYEIIHELGKHLIPLTNHCKSC